MSKRKIAVIGGGFGGLASAIRLQATGFDVTIFEKRARPGGRAYVYQDQGFTFDAGPTVVTAPDCVRELFELAGKRMEDYVELLPVSPMYRLHWEDGVKFDYTDDYESTLAQIAKLSPRDAKAYPAFLKYTEQVFEEGYTKLAHVPFLHWSTMVKVSPQLMKLQAFRTVYDIVSKYIKDPHLRQAFSFHSLLVGGNPFSASAIYTLIHFLERKWGVYFAKGGTGALVAGLARLFRDIGGTLHCESEIEEIVTANGRVEAVLTTDGTRAPVDAVVSNADVARTYLDLLKKEPRCEPQRKKMVSASWSMSLFLIYFGTKRKYPDMAHHNVIFGSRYKELLTDIFERGKLADDFSLYLHAPTVTDPSMAPEGCEAFYALSPVPHLGKAPLDWKVEGPRYADKILSYLEQRYLPNLRNEIVTQRIFTPLDFQTELNAHLGSAFSLEPLLTQSAFFRTHNRDEKVRGLYFAGAGTHPGAGIPGVISSAKATAGLVIEDFRDVIRIHGDRAVTVAPTTTPEITDEVRVALAECRQMIAVGSKSFSLASKLFGPEQRDAACFLYGWCRYCDDQVDKTVNLRLQEERVRALEEATRAAFDGRAPKNPVFIALQHIAKTYGIPSHYALELIEGMAMDVRKEHYWTFEELSLYCYRVAGCVGLMMSHIMGVSDERALRNAADLGGAMQLTNIARDVLEDAAMGRVYLPLLWLDEAGVPEGQIAHPRYREGVALVVRRLLAEADGLYRSGNAGLKYLPWRCALAVAVASEVYSRIGKLVLSRGSRAWDRRAIVSPWGKAVAVVRGALRVAASIPYRLARPWREAAITLVWRHG